MKRIKMKDVECPCCEGKGTVIANTDTRAKIDCPLCGGSGYVDQASREKWGVAPPH